MPQLESLLERLTRAQVEFIVVGGFAAVAHGVTLLTEDIDVCCRLGSENLLRIQAAIAELHPVHRLTPQKLPFAMSAADFAGVRNLYLDTDYGPLDCLGSVAGLGEYDQVLARSVAVPFPFGEVRLLSVDALIVAKMAMGRPKDLATIRQLQAIRERQKGDPRDSIPGGKR
jgi:hypothetical protein